jgi:predicted nucleic acid-binding protein
LKVTAGAIALCRTDLERMVEVIRTLAARTQAQDDRLADAAIAANLKLRQDVEVSTVSMRSALRSQKRRTERVERVVSGALAEQRRFTTRLVVAMGMVQVLGLAAVVVIG